MFDKQNAKPIGVLNMNSSNASNNSNNFNNLNNISNSNNSTNKNDEEYMRLAIELAKRGVGKVNPNPLVGAVIVKDQQILGKGHHEQYGSPHAEPNAINDALKNGKYLGGATIYVTLEPCCHHGKTPPCTEAIIKSGIKKVVVGSLDPNNLVAGKGVQALQEAGIDVVIGVLKNECKKLNKVFFHYIQTKTPYVVMKYAMTLDGKIATVGGESKWITGERARGMVQHYRNKYSAIMVGLNTVLADDPMLTCRIEGGRNPIRIICDTNLQTPIDSSVVQTAKNVRTIIATCSKQNHGKYSYLGCEVLYTAKSMHGNVCLKDLMKRLGEMGIDSLLLEGGSTLNFSAMESRIVNRVKAFISTKIFGGNTAKTAVGGAGFEKISLASMLRNTEVYKIDDDDILVKGDVDYTCLREL